MNGIVRSFLATNLAPNIQKYQVDIFYIGDAIEVQNGCFQLSSSQQSVLPKPELVPNMMDGCIKDVYL